MKKLTLITAILLCSICGYGQTRILKDATPTELANISTSSTSLLNGAKIQGFTKLEPLWYTFMGGTNGKEILRVKIPNNTIPFDSLIIYVNKSQLHWINDSTAVIRKK